MSSFGNNLVKKCLLVWLPFLLTFQISCVHRILKRVIQGIYSDIRGVIIISINKMRQTLSVLVVLLLCVVAFALLASL